MPIYTYRAVDENNCCDTCREVYETIQSIRAEALEKCPDCGNAIVRLINASNKVRMTDQNKLLSDENIKKHGFKKLVNVGGGKFDEVV